MSATERPWDELVEALAPFEEHARHRVADAPEWRDGDLIQIVVSLGQLRAVLTVLARARGEQP